MLRMQPQSMKTLSSKASRFITIIIIVFISVLFAFSFTSPIIVFIIDVNSRLEMQESQWRIRTDLRSSFADSHDLLLHPPIAISAS